MNKRYKPYINKEDGKRQEKQSCHHIYPQSRGGGNEFDNRLYLYNSVHDALHRIYGNATPTEQIFHLLFINSKALSDDFKNDIYNLLSETDNQYYYKDGILLPNGEIKNHNKK